MGGKKNVSRETPKAAPIRTEFDKLSRAGEMIFTTAMNLSKADERAFIDDLAKRNGVLEISFTVNGVQFDFGAFADEIDRQFDRATEEAAANLLVRKATGLRQRLDALMERVEERTRAAVREEFPDVRLDDE